MSKSKAKALQIPDLTGTGRTAELRLVPFQFDVLGYALLGSRFSVAQETPLCFSFHLLIFTHDQLHLFLSLSLVY